MKTNELYIQTSKEALKNSRLWLEEANNFLFERKSYGHALSLCLFSIEESVKSWICFAVGLGLVDPNEELAKAVFRSHPAKFENVVFWGLVLNIQLLQKSLHTELTETEIQKLNEFLTSIEQNFDDRIEELVQLRMKGMYVDIIDEYIQTPSDITKEEVEGCFLDALNFNINMNTALQKFEDSTEEEKQLRTEESRKIIRQFTENLENIRKLQ